MRIQYTFLALLTAFSSLLYAEGTKQLSPTNTDTAALAINNVSYSSFGSVGGPASSRLNFRVGVAAQERVYIGLSNGYANYDSLIIAGGEVPYYYRIMNPNGTVAQNWALINDASSNLDTHAEAVIGPAQLNAGGYTAFEFTPTMTGDHYIEFSTNNDGSNGGGFFLGMFDITVAKITPTLAAVDGRVYSRNWALVAPPKTQGAATIAEYFDRPFNGKFYVYSQLGFVSEVDFLDAGFRPLVFNISFNEDGTGSGGDVAKNLKSVDGVKSTNAEHEVFLNDPDPVYYESGEYGTDIRNSEYPKLIGCSSTGEYAVRVATTKPGVMEVLFDQDQTSGAGNFDPNTADRLLMLKIEPRPGEKAPYIREVPWDGLDGQGTNIASSSTLNIETTYAQVAYHLPIYDAEYLTNGFNVSLHRPTPPGGFSVVMQYDDSDIAELSNTDVELEGCAPPCHSWTSYDVGNENTLNTLWYARRQASLHTLSLQTPDCGCAALADLEIHGKAFIDANGDFIQNGSESGQNALTINLYKDANLNEQVDAGEFVTSTTTTAQGEYSFTGITVPTIPQTFDENVGVDYNDGIEYNGAYLIGYSFVGNANNITYQAAEGLRFENVTFPAGATLTSAELVVVSDGRAFSGGNEALTIDVVGIAEDNAAPFSAASLPSTRTPTTASTTLDVTTSWVSGTSHTIGGLTPIVNEIVTRANFVSGNAIAFYLNAPAAGVNANAAFRTFENDPANAPRLKLTFSGPDLPANYIVSIVASSAPGGLKIISDTLEFADFNAVDGRVCRQEFRLAADRDGDGVVDNQDLDNDNDGIPDSEEKGATAYSPTSDTDGDGILNFEDPTFNGTPPGDYTAFIDTNSDNIHDAYDKDLDGIIDAYDLDSDNDGIPDLIEAGGTDTNGDGVADDTDADGDGLADAYDNNDTDGPLGNGLDLTSPSTSNLLDPAATGTSTAVDADNDGIADYLDLDADNDGIADVAELGGTDADGDGRADNFVDTDGDGLHDLLDGDVGNDGIAENTGGALVTTGADTNGDGRPDSYLRGDEDRDGIVDCKDLDGDNDGIADVLEAGGTDTNGDGRADNFVDADNDGLSDVVDGDPSNDGSDTNTANALVLTGPDTDNDGRPDSYINNIDTDQDGIADRADLDGDNDGIADAIEAGGTDTNGDGRTDNFVDADGDGFNDVIESDPGNALAAGSDAAGSNAGNVLVATGPDTDSNGHPNSFVGNDTDLDGVLDFHDLDSDNDGITDAIEAGGVDSNGDGRIDAFVDADQDGFNDAVDTDPSNALAAGDDGAGANAANALVLTGADTDDDGRPDSYPEDLDGDGLPHFADLDSDNDGIPDVVEALGADANGDGRIDSFADADGDGLADVVDGDDDLTSAADDGNGALVVTDGAGNVIDTKMSQGVDFDADGIANWIDRDSDNDGISDLIEVGIAASIDTNQDGRLDMISDWDRDGDGLADAYDANANDGPIDGGGANPNGTPQSMTNTDSDGDGSAASEGFAVTYTGSDTDGLPDYRDLDSDNDGITDVVEQAAGATTQDASAGDLNGRMENPAGVDFVINITYTPLDTDGDGFADFIDLDADNDGIPDNLEAVCTGCAATAGSLGNDANDNGVDDAYENLTAANGSGGNNVGATPVALSADTDTTVDYLDTDTDGDTAPDWAEGFDYDGDGRAAQEFIQLAQNYASAVNATDYPSADADNDGFPDWLDNKAGSGVTESARPPFLDHTSAFWVDANNNGMADLLDAAAGGSMTTLPNSDGANDADWRDVASQAVLPVDLISFGASIQNCQLIARWTATNEQFFDHYEVELRTDTGDFTAFAKTPPQSTDRTGVNAYTEASAAPSGTVYLRLKMIDADGSYTYSDVVALESACSAVPSPSLYPNPVAAGSPVSIADFTSGTIIISDATGRQVASYAIAAGEPVEISTAALAPGVYIVTLGDASTQRLVVR